MKKILLSAISLFTMLNSYTQVQETWVYSHIAELRDQVVDANGNIYQATRTHSNSFDIDATLVIKHNKTGAEVWRRFLPALKVATALTIDAAGNVYVTGISSSLFHPSGIMHIGDNVQIYTAKLDANGLVVWTNAFLGEDAPLYGFPRSIVVNENGFPYVTGVLYTTLPEQEDQPTGEDSATADIVTIKYDAATGNRLWVRQYNGSNPGTGFDEGRAMAIDAIGHVYVSGTSQLNGFHDIVTLKYDPAGNVLWSQRYSTADQAYKYDHAGINGLKLDPAGNVIVAGGARANSSPTGGAEPGKRIIIKYTFSGFQLWVRERNVSFFSSGPMTTDNANNIIESADGETNKYNAAGDLLWTYNQDFGDLAVDADNSIYSVDACLRSDNNLCGNYYGFTTRKINSTGSLLWEKTYALFSNGGIWLNVDAEKNVYTSGSEWWSFANEGSSYYTVRYSQCDIQCPANITVNAAQGACNAVVNYSNATTSGACGSEITYSHASGSIFPVGITTVTATSTETGANCSFTITVVDNQLPAFNNCPSGKTVNTDAGQCYASANNVNPGQATATDNCGATVSYVRSDGLSITDNYPVGNTIITWTATDAANNTVTCSQTITVEDNTPPLITNTSVSHSVLSPPNHKMVNVSLSYTVTDNCAHTVNVTVASDEPETGLSNGDQGPDIVKISNNSWQLRAERDGKGDGRVYTMLITATDGSGNVSTATETVVVAHNIKGPHSGAAFRVGSTVNFSGTFWDVPGSRHTARWVIDDNTIVKATVAEPAGMGNGNVTGGYRFTAPGVYKLRMDITDQNGKTTSTTTNGDLQAIVVIYDPKGGYTYGGGNFYSAAGALTSSPSAIGDANFGFSVNYQKGKPPKGETQFDFKLEDFEFNALNYDYLVISNAKAQFRGTGRINGLQSGIAFIMTVIDGDLDGSSVDKVRIKIFNKNTGQVYYDSQPGDDDAADPLTPVGENSIIFIMNNNAPVTKRQESMIEEAIVVEMLSATAYPNPFSKQVSLDIQSPVSGLATIEFFNLSGSRVFTARKMLSAGKGNILSFPNLNRYGSLFYRVSIEGRLASGTIIKGD